MSLRKCYKQIALFSLSNVAKVCDILQNKEETESFGFLYSYSNDANKLYSFRVAASNPFNSPSSPQPPLLGNMTLLRSISRRLSISSQSPPNLYETNRLEAIGEKKEFVKLLSQSVSKIKRMSQYVSLSNMKVLNI
jgi:hypothetical protein